MARTKQSALKGGKGRPRKLLGKSSIVKNKADLPKKPHHFRPKSRSLIQFRQMNRGSHSYEPILTFRGVRRMMDRALADQDKPLEMGGSSGAYGDLSKVRMGDEVVCLMRDAVESLWVNEVMEPLRFINESFLEKTQRRAITSGRQMAAVVRMATKKYAHDVVTIFNSLAPKPSKGKKKKTA